MLKKIGHRIRKIRKNKDLTAANMAEELGMTTSAYSKIERGEVNSTTSRLIQIAEVLEVAIMELFQEPVAYSKEGKNPYGYATKEELSAMMENIMKEIEKLRHELSPKKTTHKKPYKQLKK